MFLRDKLARVRAFSMVAFAAALPAVSMAAVPEEAEAIFTTAATDFGTILGWGYTLMIAVVGGLIILGLVKKVAGKAT